MPNPICDICHKPVKLETSKTNEVGKAVHENCYLLSVSSKKAYESALKRSGNNADPIWLLGAASPVKIRKPDTMP
jgi:hypothetical protein